MKLKYIKFFESYLTDDIKSVKNAVDAQIQISKLKYDNLIDSVNYEFENYDDLYTQIKELLNSKETAFLRLKSDKEFDNIYFVSYDKGLYKLVKYYMSYSKDNGVFLFNKTEKKESTNKDEVLMFL